MPRIYKPYIPQTIGEIIDKLGWMMLYSPKFQEENDPFPGRDIDTTFFSLREGLKNVRKKVGEERYAMLIAMSDRMRAHFEADPESKTGDAQEGRDLIAKMEAMLDDLWRLESEYTGQNDN